MFVIAEAIIERRSGAFEPAGPSTALAFNMHASVVMPLLESPVTLIEAFDGHRWDSPPKIRFAPDSSAGGRRISNPRSLSEGKCWNGRTSRRGGSFFRGD